MRRVNVRDFHVHALKNGDRIPRFSEIHSLVLVKVEGTWLITMQNIVQQNPSSNAKALPTLFARCCVRSTRCVKQFDSQILNGTGDAGTEHTRT